MGAAQTNPGEINFYGPTHVTGLVIGGGVGKLETGSINADSLPMASQSRLKPHDDRILEIVRDHTLKINVEFFARMAISTIIQEAANYGLTQDDVLASLSLLRGPFMEGSNYLSPIELQKVGLTTRGFDRAIRIMRRDYGTFVRRVGQHLVKTADRESTEIAAALGESHMLVKHALRLLELDMDGAVTVTATSGDPKIGGRMRAHVNVPLLARLLAS